MIGTPCCPRAGPVGEAGVAAPAWRLSLRMVLTFLAAMICLANTRKDYKGKLLLDD